MKLNSYQKSNIILFTALAICVIAAFSVGIYLFISKNSDIPAYNDETEPITETEIMSDTFYETEPAQTATDTTFAPESETEQLSYDEKHNELLKSFYEELSFWIESESPTYHKEEETDADGNEIAPSESFKPTVAFYYMDIESGNIMEYNSEYVFYTASIIKAPYVLWTLKAIENAELEGDVKGTKFDVDNIFIYTEDKFKSGSGIIQNSEFETAYTYYDLLKLTITHSDNIAFSALRDVFGRKGFNEFSESIGVINPQKKLHSATAKEMSLYMLEIYKYFEGGTKYSEALKNWMLNTNHRIMIPSAVKPSAAASKYGWDFDAYHDVSVVFDEHPYVLVIMTELENGTKADNVFIRDLASKINEIHKSVYNEEIR